MKKVEAESLGAVHTHTQNKKINRCKSILTAIFVSNKFLTRQF